LRVLKLAMMSTVWTSFTSACRRTAQELIDLCHCFQLRFAAQNRSYKASMPRVAPIYLCNEATGDERGDLQVMGSSLAHFHVL